MIPIETAYFDNVRNNQIGGQSDGISPEVAADLGYETPDRMGKILQTLGDITSPAELAIEQPVQRLANDSASITEVVGRAVQLSQDIAGDPSLTRATPPTEAPAPSYVTRALHGMKVDGSRRADKRGR